MTDDTPMECHALDQSRDEKVQAMIIRNRRLMRREYSKNYGHDSAHPLPEPILEQSGFAPTSCEKCGAPPGIRIGLDGQRLVTLCHNCAQSYDPMEDAAQQEFLSRRGFLHGFLGSLALILALTGLLLWVGR